MSRLAFLLLFVLIDISAFSQTFEDLQTKYLALYNEGKYDEAIAVALQSKEAARKESGDTSAVYATCLNDLAFLYETVKNYDAAKPLYIEAITIRKKVLGEEHPYYATSLFNLAYLYATTGNYNAAIPLLQKTALIRKKTEGEFAAAYSDVLNAICIVYEQMGNYAAAEPWYLEKLNIIKQTGGEDHPEYMAVFSNLAFVYAELGNYTTAEQMYKDLLTLIKKKKGVEHIDYANGLNNIAYIYESTGNYAAAEPLYKQSLALTKKITGAESPDYATSLNNLAVLYEKTGNYGVAEPLFKEALNIRKKNFGTEHADYGTSLNNLAYLYESMGNYPVAIPLYAEALTVRKKALGEEHPDYATSLNNLANLYGIIGSYDTAEVLYKEALSINSRVLGEIHPAYAVTLNNLGFLYERMERYSEADTMYLLSLSAKKEIYGDEHPNFSLGLSNLASLYQRMGEYRRAANLSIAVSEIAFKGLEKNFLTLSEEEKIKWTESLAGNFHLAPSFLFNSPSSSSQFAKRVFDQQLKLKGFVLNDKAKILQLARKSGSPQLRDLLNQWQKNKEILAKQYSLPVANRMPQLDTLEETANEQEKQISQQSKLYSTAQRNQQIGFNEIEKKLSAGEAAIEFIRYNYYRKDWTDSVFYAAFVILPDDTIAHFVPLCEERQLSRLLDGKSNSSVQYVKELYRGIEIKNKQTDGKKGDTLYHLVWKPLLPLLNGIKKISIAPAGLLNRVAFNALPVDSNTYLKDKYQLRQFSSVRQVAEEKIPADVSATSTDVVLFGGIEFNPVDTISTSVNTSSILPDDVKRSMRGGIWIELAGTLTEVNNINQLFKENKKTTELITGNAATEESLKQLSGHSPAILHLATHGFSLPDAVQKFKQNPSGNTNQFSLAQNPLLRSGIIMAGANRVWNGAAPIPGKEDGIVTAYEISNLDLSNTELVVLSACETALGDIRGTEGVFGLQRAFKLAGVQNMLLSLWQVPDAETAELMKLLYTNKLKGMTTHEAFNKAQDTMRKKYPPYYWAAFVLIE